MYVGRKEGRKRTSEQAMDRPRREANRRRKASIESGTPIVLTALTEKRLRSIGVGIRRRGTSGKAIGRGGGEREGRTIDYVQQISIKKRRGRRQKRRSTCRSPKNN